MVGAACSQGRKKRIQANVLIDSNLRSMRTCVRSRNRHLNNNALAKEDVRVELLDG